MQIFKEKSKEQPSSYYAKTKLQAEHLFKDSQNSYIVRLSSLYGPNMKENTIIPNYVNMALQKNKIEVWGKDILGDDIIGKGSFPVDSIKNVES